MLLRTQAVVCSIVLGSDTRCKCRALQTCTVLTRVSIFAIDFSCCTALNVNDA
jgi:hypothetical protein